MMLTRCGVRISFALFWLFLATLFSPEVLQSRQWDTQKAIQSYQEAGQKKNQLGQAGQPDLNQYLECARTYRKVYASDPHYRHAGDAIYEEGLLYQQMGDKFGSLEHYKTAVKRLKLLVTDYEGNSNCPDALLRMATIYTNNLKDEAAAQEANQRLKTRYKRSAAALQHIQTEIAPKTPPVQENTAKPEAPKADPDAPAELQSIRYWLGGDSVRITMDMEGTASYKKARLSHPDRIYFDISGARIGKSLQSRSIAVGDAHLSKIRISQNNSTIRVVLDVSSISSYSVTELKDPFRLVVDLRYQPPETGAPSAGKESAQLKVEGSVPKNAPASEDSGTPVRVTQGPAGKREPNIIIPPPVTDSKSRPAPKAITELGRPEQSQQKKPASEAKTGIEQPKPAPPVAKSSPPPPAAVESAANAKRESVQPAPPVPNAPVIPKPEDKSLDAAKVTPPPGRDLAATPKAAPPTSHGDRTLTRMLGLKIGRIVLDPGHGGHDQGTIGPKGLYEKDLVLSLALELKTLLQEELGAEVFLTRSEDTFVSLEERTAIANQHRADLFVSIHANSSTIRSISGVETYYLDFAKTNAEREIAARENATSASTISDLEDLIKKIAKADKSAESRELASIMQTNLFSGARKLFPSTQNRGVRSAPFVVLIGANMPSILAEVAFISNPKDERVLNKKTNQKALAKALYSGIVGYMETLGSDMVHNQVTITK